MVKFLLLFIIIFAFGITAEEKVLSPGATKSKKKKEEKIKQGCCKLKYKGGGYDYAPATEAECKANSNFHQYLGENNSLCFQSLTE